MFINDWSFDHIFLLCSNTEQNSSKLHLCAIAHSFQGLNRIYIHCYCLGLPVKFRISRTNGVVESTHLWLLELIVREHVGVSSVKLLVGIRIGTNLENQLEPCWLLRGLMIVEALRWKQTENKFVLNSSKLSLSWRAKKRKFFFCYCAVHVPSISLSRLCFLCFFGVMEAIMTKINFFYFFNQKVVTLQVGKIFFLLLFRYAVFVFRLIRVSQAQ